MSGGSKEPESARDKQCPKCGLYYQDRGNSFKFHKAACSGDGEDSEGTGSGSGQETEQQATEGGTDSTTENTTTGNDSMVEFQEVSMPEGETNEQPDEQELPCGHESYRMDDAPEPPYRVQCSECGDSWRVTSHA